MTLGEMLTWHRGLCRQCTARYPCPEYTEITQEFTEVRQIWAGPVAAHTVLSVREAT